MEAFIKGLPKAEVHLHIEGTLEPDLMFRLASNHGIHLPYTLDELIAKRSNFTDLQDFLNLYYEGCNVLLSEEDFYELSKAYLERAAGEGIVYAEIFFDPQTHMNRGVAFEAVIKGLTRAAKDLEERIEAHFILSFLRDLSEESAITVIEAARPFAGLIWGIGLDSCEIGHRPGKFTSAYQLAEAAGLCGQDGTHKTAHACEEGDASYGTEAITVLHCRRLDHGVRTMEDPQLVALLRERQIPLTVCPWSNEKLKVTERFLNGRNATLDMLEAGLLACVNSDDPAYFGKYLSDTMLEVISSLPVEQQREKAITLAKNSLKATFLSEERKNHYLTMVEEYGNK